MIKKCPQCERPTEELWTTCHYCLANLDGHELFLDEKDLLEFCEALCELEFTFRNPENEAYFDFFMIFKALFDAISFHVYNNGPITQIAEFYMFASAFFQSREKFIHSDLLKERLRSTIKKIWEPLHEQNVFDSIDGVKAMLEPPRIEEKEQCEMHLKSKLWWLGTTLNIGTRIINIKTHPLLRGMYDLLALMRKTVYSPEGVDSLIAPFNELKKRWNKDMKGYEEDHGPTMENMKILFKEVSNILKK